MALQGSVLPNHVPVNNYALSVIGLPSIFFAEVSGIELEIEEVDLPDRTKASGGQIKPQEFTAKTMLHHDIERAALEAWMQEARDPVTPTYKKSGNLTHKTLSGTTNGVWTLGGVWIKKRKLPDLEKANEGEPAMIEWTFSCDNCDPI